VRRWWFPPSSNLVGFAHRLTLPLSLPLRSLALSIDACAVETDDGGTFSIAMPFLSVGHLKFDPDKAARVAVEV
jgi:hypothetical protein